MRILSNYNLHFCAILSMTYDSHFHSNTDRPHYRNRLHNYGNNYKNHTVKLSVDIPTDTLTGVINNQHVGFSSITYHKHKLNSINPTPANPNFQPIFTSFSGFFFCFSCLLAYFPQHDPIWHNVVLLGATYRLSHPQTLNGCLRWGLVCSSMLCKKEFSVSVLTAATTTNPNIVNCSVVICEFVW